MEELDVVVNVEREKVKEPESEHESQHVFGGFTKKVNKTSFKLPRHLKSVHDRHLTLLLGF